MTAVRRSVLVAASALLATAGAFAISTPAAHAVDSYVTCPSTDPGFTIGYSQNGASGADNGSLTSQVVHGLYHSTCNYRGAYWYAASGGSVVRDGRSCTWSKDYAFIGGLGGRYNVRCR